MPSKSEEIIARIKEGGGSFFANDNISEWLNSNDLIELQQEVASKVEALLRSLVIDVDNDHNTKDTARRVAKMYIQEVFRGRYDERPQITDFPNHKDLDQLYTLGPIKFKSGCSHHFVEIEGHAWVGILPGERVIGISKIARLVDWVGRRPHIQEEAVQIIADELETLLEPKGLGVVIKAKHHCMTWRGVENEDSVMITSVVRGLMMEKFTLKQEFFELIKGQGF